MPLIFLSRNSELKKENNSIEIVFVINQFMQSLGYLRWKFYLKQYIVLNRSFYKFDCPAYSYSNLDLDCDLKPPENNYNCH